MDKKTFWTFDKCWNDHVRDYFSNPKQDQEWDSQDRTAVLEKCANMALSLDMNIQDDFISKYSSFFAQAEILIPKVNEENRLEYKERVAETLLKAYYTGYGSDAWVDTDSDLWYSSRLTEDETIDCS